MGRDIVSRRVDELLGSMSHGRVCSFLSGIGFGWIGNPIIGEAYGVLVIFL